MNLNTIKIKKKRAENDDMDDVLTDYVKSNESIAYFNNIEKYLIEHINASDCVIGCVAWLTNFNILEALAKKPSQIIVQKEDFLRPDIESDNNWKNKLRNSYNKIKPAFSIDHKYEISSEKYGCGLDYLQDAIRCCGNYNYEKKSAFPRMHNKFILFCKFKDEIYVNDSFKFNYTIIVPYAVWTGSFNFTDNSTRSFENCIVSFDKKIVDRYEKEFYHIFLLSEELDWSSNWIKPEFYIGS